MCRSILCLNCIYACIQFFLYQRTLKKRSWPQCVICLNNGLTYQQTKPTNLAISLYIIWLNLSGTTNKNKRHCAAADACLGYAYSGSLTYYHTALYVSEQINSSQQIKLKTSTLTAKCQRVTMFSSELIAFSGHNVQFISGQYVKEQFKFITTWFMRQFLSTQQDWVVQSIKKCISKFVYMIYTVSRDLLKQVAPLEISWLVNTSPYQWHLIL